MFEKTFEVELLRLTSDTSLIERLWSEIKFNYGSSSRHYHNLTHLDNLVEQLLPIRYEIKDWQTLCFSVAYHDIIYNVLSTVNEEKSAALACERMKLLNLPVTIQEKCTLQILSTKHHQVSEDLDTNFFIDADLSILGSDGECYVNYANQIRNEYKYFPDLIYNPGRRKVLERFLKMEKIFKTEYFQDKYEAQARRNIENEMNGSLTVGR